MADLVELLPDQSPDKFKANKTLAGLDYAHVKSEKIASCLR